MEGCGSSYVSPTFYRLSFWELLPAIGRRTGGRGRTPAPPECTPPAASLPHGALKSVSFFFRNHTILKASPACRGQSDSSQHRAVLGPGEESQTPGASGSVAPVLHRRGGPQSAHLRYHLYVGAASNHVAFCVDALISWDGFYCFRDNSL